MRTIRTLAITLLVAACAPGEQDAVMTDSSAMDMEDADIAPAGGSGVPSGYAGRTDRPNQNIGDASYTSSGDRWEVRTGPAHIVYSVGDSVSGEYSVTATLEQAEQPEHPEAYGIFIGGQNLDQPSVEYTYFLVRGTGEYLVKVREGEETRNVVGWTASEHVPKADSTTGRGSYELTAETDADSVHFLVNDEQVAAVAAGAVPTAGIAGLRINHNLHLMVTPIAIDR
ncbi:MAG: hypothetical protein ACRENI_15410 [Gemmatimonadaceae bacterium]